MNSTKTSWFFIVNPHAGSGKTMSGWFRAEQTLIKLGVDFDTAYTDHKSHATELAYKAASEGYRKICAAGGDGSTHETYQGIMQWCDETGTDPIEFVLAVMPIGSGNDWIKSLQIPNDISIISGLIARESFGTMDVVKVASERGRVNYMTNVGGTGFDSHVCIRVNFQKEKGIRSKLLYIDGLRYTITHLKPISVRILADGEERYCGKCYSIALGNGKFSGSGMRQVPLAEINDGILDYLVVPVLPVTTLLREIPKLFSGKLHEADVLHYGKARELRIIPLDDQSADAIEIDGEICGKLPMAVTMTGKQIGVLTVRK